MKILIIYGKDEYTTARHFEEYLKRSPQHQVIGMGLIKQGLASVVGDQSWIQTGDKLVINEVLRSLPAAPEVIITMQGFQMMEIYGIENIEIPTIFYGIDTHTRTRDLIYREASKYKQVYFAQKKAIKEFKEIYNKESGWMPCCAEPLIHKPMDFDLEYDFAFVGGADLPEAHKLRRETLKKLMTKYKVFIGNAYGYFMSMVYNKARVVFNHACNDDVNMRIFEAMACKRALLTNNLSPESGLNDLFEAGKHYIPFDDKNLMDQAEKLIKDDKLRQLIAETGYKEVLEKHTYEKRMEEMLCQIKK